jgi:TatD DNase family protein
MMAGITDTHAHICDPSFDADRAEVLERAEQAGVSAIIAVSETLADARKNLRLAAEYPIIRAAAGLYPTYLDLQEAEAILTFIRQECTNLCAIGEVGLDHWKVKEENDRTRQREIFRQFIELSLELDLPLNVHSRSAGRHAIALLLECGAKRVQMHAFDGKASTALPAVEAGYFFSIPPSIVRSRQKQKLVKQLPLSCLLGETDSPVLAPNPDERNEPANVVLAIEAIAEIKQVSQEEVVEAVIENTQQLYGEFI